LVQERGNILVLLNPAGNYVNMPGVGFRRGILVADAPTALYTKTKGGKIIISF
jgi:hypothetical protein